MIPLLRSAHLQPSLAVTAVATALAVSVDRSAAGVAAVALAVLAGQLSVGWSNDYLDRHRDRLTGRSDKPLATGAVHAQTVAIAAAVALTACAGLSLLSGWRATVVHLTAVALAWSYNLGLKSTPISVVPYALAFAALPAFVTLGLDDHPLPPAWAMAAAASLGAGAHFLNTLPDLADDAAAGIHGLPHRLGPRPSLFLGATLIAAAIATVTLAPDDPLDLPATVLSAGAAATLAVAVAAGLRSGEPRRERVAWPLVLVAALLTVAAFVTRGAALVP